MNTPEHVPVLFNEVLSFLDPREGSVIVDCTLNGGGHTAGIVARGATVLGIEWDPSIARSFSQLHPELSGKVTVVNDSYVNLAAIVAAQGIVPSGILMDLGLSSVHYEAGRGFSFAHPDDPLDMRFNPETTTRTAGDIVNTATPQELEHILTEYGAEQFAGQIAAAVAISRRTAPFRTVGELVRAIESAVPAWYRHRKLHCATKTFQALRVVVNDELANVAAGIAAAVGVLAPGGRLVVISFQGDEDKIVREYFKTKVKEGVVRWVQRATVRPAWSEISANRRSRSAKLKVIEKL